MALSDADRSNAYILVYKKICTPTNMEEITTAAEPVIERTKRVRNPSRKVQEELDVINGKKETNRAPSKMSNVQNDLVDTEDKGTIEGNDIVESEEELFCFCRQPADGIMIDCSKCSDWFHTKCIDYCCDKCSAPNNSNEGSSDQNVEKMGQKTNEISSGKNAKAKAGKQKSVKTAEEVLRNENATLQGKIKDLERKLFAKNKALDAVTVTCQRNQNDAKLDSNT